jgi:hypothetical protein
MPDWARNLVPPPTANPGDAVQVACCNHLFDKSLSPTRVVSTQASAASSPRRKSTTGVLSSRLYETESPSTRISNGFLIAALRVAPSSEKFKQTISSNCRFAETSALTHLSVKVCESSNTFSAAAPCSDRLRSQASTCKLSRAIRSRSSVPLAANSFLVFTFSAR